jgi:hypothetical protein
MKLKSLILAILLKMLLVQHPLSNKAFKQIVYPFLDLHLNHPQNIISMRMKLKTKTIKLLEDRITVRNKIK